MPNREKDKKAKQVPSDSPLGQRHGGRGSDSGSSQQGGQTARTGRGNADQSRDEAGHFTEGGHQGSRSGSGKGAFGLDEVEDQEEER